MKWAVIGLFLLGSIAAMCAALLVNAMRAQAASTHMPDAATTAPAEITILVAKRPLQPMTVIESSVVSSKTIRIEQAPAHYLTSSIEVVGRVLAKPVVEGQPFTTACFTDAGPSQQVAAVIPTGKRAVGIAVTNYAGLEGLLYPGSMVDVLVSLKAGEGASGADRREAVTTTLLENVQVLAIEQQTVVSPGRTVNEMDNTGRAGDTRSVTLLVDSRQAKALQLGMEQGILSLALRNPLDASSADTELVWLHSLTGQDPKLAGNKIVPAPAELAPPAPVAMAPATAPAEEKLSIKEPPHWDTVIMRAGAMETKSFPMPGASDAN